MTAQISFTGNATSDAELKFSQAGKPWASLTVAVTPREKQQDGSYGDGPAAFYRVACFGSLAENVAESVQRGTRVTVVGQLKPREYEHEGQKRVSLDVAADSVAADLRFATAQVAKAQRGNQGNQGGWGGQGQQQPGHGGGFPSSSDGSVPPFSR